MILLFSHSAYPLWKIFSIWKPPLLSLSAAHHLSPECQVPVFFCMWTSLPFTSSPSQSELSHLPTMPTTTNESLLLLHHFIQNLKPEIRKFTQPLFSSIKHVSQVAYSSQVSTLCIFSSLALVGAISNVSNLLAGLPVTGLVLSHFHA